MSKLLKTKRANLIYRSGFSMGSLLDYSDSGGHNGTGTNTAFRNTKWGRALYCTDTRVDTGSEWIGTANNLTICALIKPNSMGNTNGRILDNGKTVLRMTTGNKVIFSSNDESAGAGVSSAASSVPFGSWTFVVVTRAGTVGNAYINGVLSGAADQNSGALTAGTTNVIIGNINAGTRDFDGLIQSFFVFNVTLTASEISQLNAEVLQMRDWTRPDISSYQGACNILSDGDMELADVTPIWTATTSTPTKETTSPYQGSKVLRITTAGASGGAYQNILTIGDRYMVTGKARSVDGVGVPRVYIGNSTVGWTGTTSTSWQDISVVGTLADAIRFYLWNTALNSAVDFDNIKVQPFLRNSYYNKPQKILRSRGMGWNESDNSRTAGYLENTGFQIISGTHKVEARSGSKIGQKDIVTKTAGILARPSQQVYGVWEFDLNKGATANTGRVMIMASQATARNVAGQNGYLLAFNDAESLGLYVITNGSASYGFVTASNYLSATATTYRIRIVRYAGGRFYAYIKGGTFTNWTLIDVTGGAGGTNPFTNNTFTTSNFITTENEANALVGDIYMRPFYDTF